MSNLKINYVDQSAEALNLTILRGAVDSAQFQVLRVATLNGSGFATPFSINFAIIGESHLAIFAVDSQPILSEVFACGVGAKGDAVVNFPRLLSMPHFWEMCTDRYDYSFQVRIHSSLERSLPPAVEAEVDRINAQANYPTEDTSGLVFTFPRGPHDQFDPQTVVVVRIDEFQMMISSLHSYPNEGTIVMTSSIFTPKGRS